MLSVLQGVFMKLRLLLKQVLFICSMALQLAYLLLSYLGAIIFFLLVFLKSGLRATGLRYATLDLEILAETILLVACVAWSWVRIKNFQHVDILRKIEELADNFPKAEDEDQSRPSDDP